MQFLGRELGRAARSGAAVAWRSELRAQDVLGRWGGEEFCVLLADCDLDAATAIADRLRATVPVGSCSVGVAGWDRAPALLGPPLLAG